MDTQTATPMPADAEMYDAFARRDASWEGIFVAGVKTTGIFCRPGCPARTPNRENVEFFRGVRDAALAGYRPCLRCHPLQPAGEEPEGIRALVRELAADPEARITDQGLRDRGLHPEQVRRWFRKHHGMTFHAYQRARNLGRALSQIRQGEDVTQSAFGSGYESLSGFRDAFARMFNTTPGRADGATMLAVTRILTPLGAMLAAASDEHLYLLEFVDRRMLQTQLATLRRRTGATFVPGDNAVLAQTQAQIAAYFAGELTTFSVPLSLPGTAFQQRVWEGLRAIPYGALRSYAEQAAHIGAPAAVRAVGKANGDNRVAIIVPCHRVVGANGALTGYGGQLWRKRALLELEGAPLGAA